MENTAFIPAYGEQNLYEQVVQELEHHPNLIRIKKLLVCVCKHTWENDPAKLGSFQLRELVQETMDWFPTLPDLKSSLEKIVNTLNKPGEYLLIANLITSKLARLYPEYQEPSDLLFEQVVNALEQSQDWVRIKKFLVCVSRNIWSNDPVYLNTIPLTDLIQEILVLISSQAKLKSRSEEIIKTLNKKSEYIAVANVILCHLGQLYPDYSAAASISLGSEKLTPPPVPASLPSSTYVTPIAAGADLECLSSQEQALKKSRLVSSLFDLRAKVMRTTNPLRAKILIFSAMNYKLDVARQDWSIVKTHDLYDLLASLLVAHPTVDTLEAQLINTAKRLAESEPNLQAASAITKALRPFYENVDQYQTLIEMNANANLTSSTQSLGSSQRQRSDDEMTCQLLPP